MMSNGYPVTVSFPVQWGDQDALSHVNNVVYLRWVESSRIAYLERVALSGGLAPIGIGPILASIKCDYRRQVTYPDTVSIGAKVLRIGRTSITMSHEITSESQNAVVAEVESTVVVFDYRENRPVPVPDPVRKLIESLEGRSL